MKATLSVRIAIVVVLWGTWTPGGAEAQGENSPISCWWRTDQAAVRVAEPFGLTLTCRVLETDRAVVVPNVTTIEPTSLELTPFDVVEGTRHEDVVRPPWRYLQFEYTVRLLGEEFFGRDVPIPPTNVTFRVQTGGVEAVEGTEHTYVLPSIPVRILSLLPAQADDIRDPSVDTLGDIESRRFRSTAALVVSMVMFGFSGVLLVIAAVHGIERFRNRGPAVEPRLPAYTLLGSCLHEVVRIRSEAARDGWSPSLAARALAPFRVAAAVALSQPIAHRFVSGDTAVREGQLSVRKGLLRRRRALVSAAVTTDAIDRAETSGNGRRPSGPSRDAVHRIREALAGLSAVRYGRNGHVDAAELDRLLESGITALRRLRRARLVPTRANRALATSAAILGGEAWRR